MLKFDELETFCKEQKLNEELNHCNEGEFIARIVKRVDIPEHLLIEDLATMHRDFFMGRRL